MKDAPGPAPRTVAFIDIGTNSIRLLVVRIRTDGSFAVQSRQKETVRLGEGEFAEESIIQPEPMERAVMVARRFRDMAVAFGATEIIAIATSATREAGNRVRFLGRLRREALLEVHPISGREEARLIYLGVARALHLAGKKALFIDIGGGSTEIAVGDGGDPVYVDSLKLGGIRLTNLLPGGRGSAPVSRKVLREMKGLVGDTIVRTVESVKREMVDLAVGSSGTIENLGEIAMKNVPEAGQVSGSTLTLGQLRSIITLLSGMGLEERRKVPGINPERADIIIPGAVILETFMERIGLERIGISRRSLQDGLLEDYLARNAHGSDLHGMGVRERSVLRLARSCGVDEGHARSTRALSLQLFDSARVIGLHDLGERERDLLGFAALLHDTGKFISFSNHHEHSYYVVRNADLLGFDDTELAILANVVRVHRKKFEGKRMQDRGDLVGGSRRIIRILGILLRLAEGLDRSHAGLVREVRLTDGDEGTVILELLAEGGCDLELSAVERHRKAFASVFRKELAISHRCGPPSAEGTGTRD
jgi:exopolyphosphatase/guanosine-5'-triphosphate,3'-diphosphate pyrophosphatase